MHLCQNNKALKINVLNRRLSLLLIILQIIHQSNHIMSHHYTIRTAKDADKDKIHHLIRESIARAKQLPSASLVPVGFMEEFVDKNIRKGNMLVVENHMDELELIGEIHDYRATGRSQDEGVYLREFTFFSRLDSTEGGRETDIVNWLFGEIEKKHSNVFRVELNTVVRNAASVEHYIKMGLQVEGNFSGRLKNSDSGLQLFVPLSWSNPSFN